MEVLVLEVPVFNGNIKDKEYCPKVCLSFFFSTACPMTNVHMQVHEVPYPGIPEHTGALFS